MATHSVVHQVFADALQHCHDKMVAEVLGMLGFEERDFTPEGYQLLRAFDPAPLADVLVAASQRKLNKKKPNAST